MKFIGTIFKYGDHVDTDVIIPARYLTTQDAKELAVHCLEDLDAQFAKKVQPGDIVLGGVNFGSGSSREQAVIAIQGCGVGLVLAKSFSRIFYRNALNRGLCPLQIDEGCYDLIQDGDRVEIDILQGTIRNLTTGIDSTIAPAERKVVELVESGGVVNLVKAKLMEGNNE